MEHETTTMDPTLTKIGSFHHLEDHPADKKWTVEESYDFCRQLTVSHYENFPVGSLLIPKHLRSHVHAIYSFARVSDDFADEADYKGKRMDLLNEWERMLADCYEGKAEHPIFIALGETVKTIDLPIELFQGLLKAFKMDVTVNRYEDFDQVLGYCRYSANPVGRLILHLFNYRDDELFLLSDCICTALQLANFWQDVTIDLKKDRSYIPKNEMKRENYTEADLFALVYDERFVRLMEPLVKRTWRLFNEGCTLVERVKWPLNAELRFTWLGGTTILHRVLQNEFNVFEHRPTLSKGDFLKMGLRSFFRIKGTRKKLNQAFENTRQK